MFCPSCGAASAKTFSQRLELFVCHVCASAWSGRMVAQIKHLLERQKQQHATTQSDAHLELSWN